MAAGTIRENKTVLTAEDRTASAFASFQRNLKDSQDRVESMRGAFAGLVAGGAVGGFVLMMENAIEAVAKMKDLASDAGLSVAQFGRFEAAARLAGMTLEDVSASMQKFSKTLVAAKDPASEAAQALKAFGLSAAQLQGLSLDQQYEALARASDQYSGSAEKNAALMALTGKTGAQLQKLFAEIAEQQVLATSVTDQQADAAKRLQDDMTRLKMRSEEFARNGAAVVVPYLQNVLNAFVELRGKQGETTGFFDLVGKAAAYAAGIVGSLWLALTDMGDAIGATAAKAAALLRGDFAAIAAIDADREERLKANNAQYEKMWASLLKVDGANKAAAESGKAVVSFAPAIAKMTDEYTKFAGSIQTKIAADQQELDTGVKMLESEKMLKDIRNGVYDKKFTDQQLVMIELLAQEWVATQKAVAAKKELARWDAEVLRVQKEMQQAELDEINARDDLLNSFEDGNAQLQIEVATLGMTATQRDLYLLGLQKEQLLKAALTEKDIAYINKLTEERAALLQNREAAANQVSVWNDLADVIVSTFHRGRDALKDFLRSMLDLFAKKYILQIGAAITGSTALSASASMLGQGSAAGSLGNLIGLGSFGTLAGAGGGVLAGGTLDAIANGASVFGASLGSGSLSGMAAGGSQMLTAAAPYLALAGLAVGVYQYLQSKRGGPKEGGSFTSLADASGVLGGSSPGWYGVSTATSQVQGLTGGTAAAYAAYLKAFGGTGSASFGLGFDADPKGTANSRITNTVGVNGRTVYDVQGMDVGRDPAALQSALQLEASRALLAALQASSLPKELGDLFSSVTAQGATQAEIDALMAAAVELNGVLGTLATTTIKGLTIDSLKAMQRAGESLAQTAARVTGGFAALQDLFSTDAEKTARDMAAIARQFDAIGVAVPESNEAFKELIASVDLSTEAGRALADVLMATGPRFKEIQDGLGKMVDNTVAAVTAAVNTLTTGGMIDAATQAGDDIFNALSSHFSGGQLSAALQNEITRLTAQVTTPFSQAALIIANLQSHLNAIAAEQLAARAAAQGNLAGYLNGSLVSAASPLDPMARYAEAKRQYDANLTAAQAGDVNAINAFGGLRDQFLTASRAVYASSGQYNTDFFASFNAGAALTGGAVQPYTTAAANANTQTIVQALAASTSATIEAANAAVDATNALLARIAENTSKPAVPGALTSTTL